MKIALFHCKDNRRIYHTLFESMCSGLANIGVSFDYFVNEREAKRVGEQADYDLSIVFTNALTRVGSIKDRQARHGGKWVTLYCSPIQKNELLSFENRESYLNSVQDDLYIYCDLVDNKYQAHVYIENKDSGDKRGGSLYSYAYSLKSRYDPNGPIIIPQQVFPEGIVPEGDLIALKIDFDKWLDIHIKKIRSSGFLNKIIVSKHPNRKVDYTPSYDNVEFSDIGTSNLMAQGCSMLYTLSSKVAIESILHKIPTVNYDLNSPLRICYRTLNTDTEKICSINTSIRIALNDLAHSVWTKKEVCDGQYASYLLNELVPYYDRRFVGL